MFDKPFDIHCIVCIVPCQNGIDSISQVNEDQPCYLHGYLGMTLMLAHVALWLQLPRVASHIAYCVCHMLAPTLA